MLCNSGPLMALGKLNRLELLAALYAEIIVPSAVYEEVVTQGFARGAPDALTVRLFLERRRWPIVEVPDDVLSSYTPPVVLDPGELEVLALARVRADPLLLLDDEVARVEARRLGLRVCGTLGILVRAYRKHLHSFDQLELLVQEIAARPDIWIASRLCQAVLDSAREAPQDLG